MPSLLAFGAAALFLTAPGIYRVMNFIIACRTREFDLRRALGACDGQIVGTVLRRGPGTGLALGVHRSGRSVAP